MMILVIIVYYFAILLLIARITGRRRGSNTTSFRGENQSPWCIVALGMIGTSVSGVTFVSVPGVVKAVGMTYMQTVFGFFFGYLTVTHIFLPLYYKLNLTSIYTYLDTRIGKHAYRTGASFFLLSCMLGTAAKLHLVCLILHTYMFRGMGIPLWSIVAGSIALAWMYTHKSDIKTIVWADTLQTFCLIVTLICILVFVIVELNLDFSGVIQTISNSGHSRTSVFDDWMSRQNFFKQSLNGTFIVIVVTGFNQDMMRKNLSYRSLHGTQGNMYCYGFAFAPLDLLFLGLGILLLALAQEMQLELPVTGDGILPMFTTQEYPGEKVLILFTIGIIAAAFSSSDSVLTAMTTSFYIDLLDTRKDTEGIARKKRNRVHIGLSILLVLFICLVNALNSQSIIDAIYIIASYTYGPPLGMFASDLFTRRQTNDRYIPFTAIVSPLMCYAADRLAHQKTGYQFGYELLMPNDMLTFTGVWTALGKTTKKWI